MTLIRTSQPSDYDETDLSAPAPSLDMWPTPQAHDAAAGDPKRGGRYGTKDGGRNLTHEVHLWPTPRSGETSDQTSYPGHFFGLSAAVQRPEMLTAVDAPVRSTSSTAGHPVSPLAQRVSALVRAIAAGDGLSASGSLARFDPDGLYWRTPQACLAFDMQEGSRPLDEYSQSWPRWGIVAAGEHGRLLMSALRTDASACSSWDDSAMNWPTPQAADSAQGAVVGATEEYRTLPSGRLRKYTQNGKDGSPSLGHLATPADREGKRQVDLGHHVRNVEQGTDGWPTPQATDGSKGGPDQAESQPMPSAKVGGQLSARWVSLLMALPADYLSIPPLPGRAGRRVQAVHKKAMSPRA